MKCQQEKPTQDPLKDPYMMLVADPDLPVAAEYIRLANAYLRKFPFIDSRGGLELAQFRIVSQAEIHVTSYGMHGNQGIFNQ